MATILYLDTEIEVKTLIPKSWFIPEAKHTYITVKEALTRKDIREHIDLGFLIREGVTVSKEVKDFALLTSAELKSSLMKPTDRYLLIDTETSRVSMYSTLLWNTAFTLVFVFGMIFMYFIILILK